MEFKDILKKRRLQAGLTQAELAELAGVTESSISYYESGARVPIVKTADKLAKALGCTLNDLFIEPEQ